jgi:hypothetical protein
MVYTIHSPISFVSNEFPQERQAFTMTSVKRKGFVIAAMLISIGTWAITACAQTYNEYFGNQMHVFTYLESKVEKTIKIVLASEERTEICFLDSNFFCLKWIYTNKLNGYEFTAIRSSDTIHITGKKDGSEFNNSIKTGNQPWLQFWEFGIAKMIAAGKNEMTFSSIDAKKPSMSATFLVKKREPVSIKTGNCLEEANHVTITIKGLPAMIFTANMWFRKIDNDFLKSEMPQGPFVPITKIEIQNEKIKSPN